MILEIPTIYCFLVLISTVRVWYLQYEYTRDTYHILFSGFDFHDQGLVPIPVMLQYEYTRDTYCISFSGFDFHNQGLVPIWIMLQYNPRLPVQTGVVKLHQTADC